MATVCLLPDEAAQLVGNISDGLARLATAAADPAEEAMSGAADLAAPTARIGALEARLNELEPGGPAGAR